MNGDLRGLCYTRIQQINQTIDMKSGMNEREENL